MNESGAGRLSELLQRGQAELLTAWLREQTSTLRRTGPTQESELREQCTEFLALLGNAISTGGELDVKSSGSERVRELLQQVSRSRALQGFTPTETATFVFSLKRPLFEALRAEVTDVNALADEIWSATVLLDQLGLYTAEVYQKTRDEIISRQQEELMELSTPVVKLWDGILALPIIGTLDSARTQTIMESLLQTIVDTGSEIAIIDITGVPTVDTLTAQHLLKTVTAARLMGAECIISGIRPQIAQTIVHLGVELGDVVTKASLADAFLLALKRTGATIGRGSGRA